MKTTIRIFAMTLALAGLATSSFSRPTTQVIPNQPVPFASVSGLNAMPIPACLPNPCTPKTPGVAGLR